MGKLEAHGVGEFVSETTLNYKVKIVNNVNMTNINKIYSSLIINSSHTNSHLI